MIFLLLIEDPLEVGTILVENGIDSRFRLVFNLVVI